MLFCQLHDIADFGADLVIVLPAVGFQAIGAVLNAVFRVGKGTAALVPRAYRGQKQNRQLNFSGSAPAWQGKYSQSLC